ncbi:uncharacterized protein LOC143670753 [Tamandua tetradactyla]|uniref:uncharacterized protein LOC143670753 n=1 Tax=Tamandua tetradactyla TaxID=48850 RepID=UPI004053B0BF
MGSEGHSKGSAAVEGAYEGAGGEARAAEEPGVQRGPGGPNARGGPGGPNPQGGPDAQGGPGGLDVRGGPDAQGGPGGPGGPRGPCGGRGDDAAARDAPQVAQAPLDPGPNGDVAPEAGGPGSRVLEFTLTVPFRSSLEAEMARRSLIPSDQRQGQGIQKDFAVTGSVLAVRWTAEDPVLLRMSVNAFLSQLSLVMRNIQRIGPPFPLSLGREKGAEP